MSILIRLSPALVYGDKLKLVELLGDIVGLAVNDIHDIMVSYFEYQWFNGPKSFSDRELVDTYFMGNTMGYELLYAVINQFPEINAYIPDAVKTIRYARSYKDGFYLVCELDDAATPNL